MDILTLSLLFTSVWLFDTISNGYPKFSRWLLQILEDSDRAQQSNIDGRIKLPELKGTLQPLSLETFKLSAIQGREKGLGSSQGLQLGVWGVTEPCRSGMSSREKLPISLKILGKTQSDRYNL